MELDLNIFENQFLNVNLDLENHQYYYNGEKCNFLSVTSLIHKYETPFDEDKALMYALRKKENKGKKREDILKEWKLKSDNSSEKGTEIHDFINKRLLSNDYIDSDIKYKKEIEYFNNFLNDFYNNCKTIYTEKIIYDLEDEVMGTLDCLAYDEKEEILYFIDWKTNEKITIDNPYANFLKPFHSYDQSLKNKYTFQISIYRYIIEKNILSKIPGFNNLQIKNILVHLNKDNDNYQIIELPYYKFSIKQMIKLNKEKKQ